MPPPLTEPGDCCRGHHYSEDLALFRGFGKRLSQTIHYLEIVTGGAVHGP